MQGNAIFSLQFTGLQFICIWFYPSCWRGGSFSIKFVVWHFAFTGRHSN